MPDGKHLRSQVLLNDYVATFLSHHCYRYYFIETGSGSAHLFPLLQCLSHYRHAAISSIPITAPSTDSLINV